MIKATDENLKELVHKGIEKYGPNADLNYIDTSEVIYMGFLFTNSYYDNSHFNGDISSWDTHNVRYMFNMFSGSFFNGDISRWDTHNVEDMSFMFSNSVFNQDISGWDVRSVEDMIYMFADTPFNHDINRWDISGVKNMYNIFYYSKYDKEITWDVNIEKLFTNSYDDYMDRMRLKMLESLCM